MCSLSLVQVSLNYIALDSMENFKNPLLSRSKHLPASFGAFLGSSEKDLSLNPLLWKSHTDGGRPAQRIITITSARYRPNTLHLIPKNLKGNRWQNMPKYQNGYEATNPTLVPAPAMQPQWLQPFGTNVQRANSITLYLFRYQTWPEPATQLQWLANGAFDNKQLAETNLFLITVESSSISFLESLEVILRSP